MIGVQLPERCDSSSYSYTFIYKRTFQCKDFYLIFMIVLQSNIKYKNVLLSCKLFFFLFYFHSTCLRLGSVLWNANVPFLVCRTYGLVGYMRLVVKEHTGIVNLVSHECIAVSVVMVTSTQGQCSLAVNRKHSNKLFAVTPSSD